MRVRIMMACVFAVALLKVAQLAMSTTPTVIALPTQTTASFREFSANGTAVPPAVVIKSTSPVAPHSAKLSDKLVRYNRKLCSGLGDRIAVILNVAAFARTMNASCFMFWCDENKGATDQYRKGRYYGIDAIRRFMKLPSNIIMLSYDEFHVAAKDAPDISYDRGELVSHEAYDSVYTLAHRTMTFPNHFPTYQRFLEAYRYVGAEWTAAVDGVQPVSLPLKYVVLHLRQGDKDGGGVDSYSVGGNANYCTFDVLAKLSISGVPVVLISDSPAAKKKILTDFGDFVAVPNARGFTKIENEMLDLALMMRATAIVQHVKDGWSSYSNVVAMAKQIPLLTTVRYGWNRLNDFAEKGGCPQEFAKCDAKDAFADALTLAMRAQLDLTSDER